MIEIEKPQIECIETPGEASYGKYGVEPLERGYGTTLGNALRRIMLSSLPGTAATSIKIAGVQHEFSTIPGVKEDVTEIVLNIKGLLTKLHTESGKTVYIEATGPCEVTAGDIKADAEVEVLNPELHIATLDSGASLNMEITLSHGRGYVSADRNKAAQPQTVIGVIPVDSIYTPVYKVNFTVEPTRVGASSDFDKLTLEVWTDGTISARDAVSLGAKRMTYEQVLCPNDTLLLNNSYLLQQFSLRTHEITPFANKKNSMKAMLDASGDLALWYTGEESVVCDFCSNTEMWREGVKCKKSKNPNFAYYCFGMLSPRQSKAAYRVTEDEYVLVDLKSAQKVVIPNAGWHPFFSPDDQCFSVGGKFYLAQTGEEMDNPFPFSVRQGLSFSDTCAVRTRGSLMAGSA